MNKDLEYYINLNNDIGGCFSHNNKKHYSDKYEFIILKLFNELNKKIDNISSESGTSLTYTKELIDNIILDFLTQLILYSLEKLPVDDRLSKYSKNPVLNKVISEALELIVIPNFKTINGQSILGEGNIQISSQQQSDEYVTQLDLINSLTHYVSENDLQEYLTMEDLVSYMNPLRVTASINPSLSEFTGNDINVIINISVRKGDRNINPDSLEIVLPDSSVLQLNSLQYSTIVNHKGTTNFVIRCLYGSESSSTQVSTNQVLPTYIGIDSDNPNILNLTKKIISGISMLETLTNSIPGNYLWIISPHTVNKISTDAGGTFTVGFSLIKNEDGFNYYRSIDQLDISTITYYIR